MVPARKTSKSVKRSRRSHHALKAINLCACPRCGTAKLPHRACAGCGYVNSRVSIEVHSEES